MRAGLESARDEGRIGGRRPKLLPQQQTEVVKMVVQGKKTAADAARLFNVHPRRSQGSLRVPSAKLPAPRGTQSATFQPAAC